MPWQPESWVQCPPRPEPVSYTHLDVYKRQRQRQGCGSSLLDFAIAHCAGTPTLWILSNNHRARSFYEKHGFQFTGRTHPLSGGLAELEMYLPGS